MSCPPSSWCLGQHDAPRLVSVGTANLLSRWRKRGFNISENSEVASFHECDSLLAGKVPFCLNLHPCVRAKVPSCREWLQEIGYRRRVERNTDRLRGILCLHPERRIGDTAVTAMFRDIGAIEGQREPPALHPRSGGPSCDNQCQAGNVNCRRPRCGEICNAESYNWARINCFGRASVRSTICFRSPVRLNPFQSDPLKRVSAIRRVEWPITNKGGACFFPQCAGLTTGLSN